jgi:hypothetical protein
VPRNIARLKIINGPSQTTQNEFAQILTASIARASFLIAQHYPVAEGRPFIAQWLLIEVQKMGQIECVDQSDLNCSWAHASPRLTSLKHRIGHNTYVELGFHAVGKGYFRSSPETFFSVRFHKIGLRSHRPMNVSRSVRSSRLYGEHQNSVQGGRLCSEELSHPENQ